MHENYARNDELCQNVGQHSLTKPSFIHPSPLFVKLSTTSSLPDQIGNQTITSFLGGSRIEIAFGSILIQRDLRFSDWYKAF